MISPGRLPREVVQGFSIPRILWINVEESKENNNEEKEVSINAKGSESH